MSAGLKLPAALIAFAQQNASRLFDFTDTPTLEQRATYVARKEGIGMLEASTLSDNFSMKDVFARAGFRFSQPEDGVVTASLNL
jgi:hypothetical protein